MLFTFNIFIHAQVIDYNSELIPNPKKESKLTLGKFWYNVKNVFKKKEPEDKTTAYKSFIKNVDSLATVMQELTKGSVDHDEWNETLQKSTLIFETIKTNKIIFYGLNFATNSHTLSANAKSMIDRELIEKIKAVTEKYFGFYHEQLIVELEFHGYTDKTGSARHNDKLSERRAKSVRTYTLYNLNDLKIDGKLQIKGQGIRHYGEYTQDFDVRNTVISRYGKIPTFACSEMRVVVVFMFIYF